MKYYGKDHGFEDLANAIVYSGVRDYKRALIRLKRNPDSKSAEKAVKECERFLYSSWFEMLTDVHPDYLVRHLKQEIDQKYG